MPTTRASASCLAICLVSVAPAAAQPAARTGAFVSLNVAMQDGPQKLAVSVPTEVFRIGGTIDVDDRIDGATLFDVRGGVRGRRFVFDVGYFQTENNQSHEFTAGTTPLNAGGFRLTTNGITPALEHRERVVYLDAGLVRSVTDRFDFGVSAGPAFFRLRQELPVSITQDPLRGQVDTMQTRSVEESAIGFHGALELNYMFHPRLGIGSTVRYSHASVELPDSTESMTLGGFQFGAGLRVRF